MGDDYLKGYDDVAGDKEYITSSQITEFVDCSVSYRKKYIERIRSGSGSAATFGTAGHFAENEISLRPKIITKKDMPLDVVLDAFRDKLQSMKGDINWNKDERKAGLRKLWRSMHAGGIDAMTRLHLDLAPSIQPITIEAKIRIPLANFPRDILGCWDIETRRDIVDWKFKGKTPSQADADSNLGLTVYWAAKKAKDGIAPRSIRMAGIVKLKKAKTFNLVTKRNDDDFHRVLLTISKIQKSIDAGIFLPASPLSWRCTPKWCPFFETCTERIKR